MKSSALLRALLTCAIYLFFARTASAIQTDIPGPSGSGLFGQSVKVLPNGNFVVSDLLYDAPGPIADVGRVYLYNGSTLALINTVTGTAANDRVGTSVTVLANGDYVVASSAWNSGRGAATLCSAATGCPSTISAANSLVGSATTHGVGFGVTALPNGSYVVRSPSWDNAATSTANVGAITWCDGSSGCVGAVSTANSLVGSTAGDSVGNFDIVVLSNGDYVVRSLFWNNGPANAAGAATRCSGTAACVGAVSPANSLVGSSASDFVGNIGITPLTNGGYVVNTAEWDNGGNTDLGAVTFCAPVSGCTGVISAANSLVGSSPNDQIGLSRTVALSNGNYVVRSPFWNNGGIVDAGAATFCSGTTGCVGAVSAANSLVGSTMNDKVSGFANGGIYALSNGNYVVCSPNWRNVATSTANVGAVTWCSGTSGCTGPVAAATSLTGTTAGDLLGDVGTTVLTNGNYVVLSPSWDDLSTFRIDAGAATFCNGASGCSGSVTSGNSLVGSSSGDRVGATNAIALSNGNYVVLSPFWDNPGTANVGAATLCNGATGCGGTISSGNSLIGSSNGDQVGFLGVALTGGNYLVQSPSWTNAGITLAGAVTRAGSAGITGTVTTANSLVGSTMNDQLGGFGGATVLANGDYIVRSETWDDAGIMDAGAVSYGLGNGATVGPLTASNSVRGTTPSGGSAQNFSVGSPTNLLVVGRPADNIVTVFAQGGGAPQATSVVSRKVHGGTPRDIELPLSGNSGVECRRGSGANVDGHQVIVTFAASVTVGGVTVVSSDGMATAGNSVSGAIVTIALATITDAQTIQITLTNVSDGTNTGDVTIPMGVLRGDSNADRFVNSGDALQTRSRAGQAPDATNFRSDVNPDGLINSGDTTIVRNASGHFLP